MPAVIERLSEFIKEVLTGWITSNLQGMFTDVNDKVGTIAAEVGQTPSTWNGSIFSMVQSLSDTVIVPIAGMVITAVLCYELINAVISSNAIHDQDVGVLFKYLFKAGIAVWLLSHTSDMVLGIFDIGSYVVSQAGGAISGSTNIDVEATLEQKEILFVKEAPEAMELAKALEALGNENAGYTPKENDPVRKEWLLNTAQDIKDGNTTTIIKAVSDMSETTENIAVTKKAVGFLIKLDAVKGKWEPAPKEVEKLFEQKESPKPEKAADHKKIAPKEMTFSQKLESAQKKADTINAARKHGLQL